MTHEIRKLGLLLIFGACCLSASTSPKLDDKPDKKTSCATDICELDSCHCDKKEITCNDLITNNKPFFSCLGGNVTQLTIVRSDITTLTENSTGDSMGHLVNLTRLEIEDSPKLVQIDETAFEHLTKLTDLVLGNISVKSLKPDIFSHQVKLKLLSITWTLLSNLTADHFKSFEKSLHELVLSNNRIRNISGGIITTPNNSLVILDLSSNKLTKIEDVLLANLFKLERLDLSGNSIASFSPGSIKDLVAIKELDLHSNYISTIPADIQMQAVPPLQKLNISYNLLNDNHWSSNDLFWINKTLQILDLSGNKFIEIRSDAFEGLVNLEELYLSNMDKLITVSENAFSDLNGLKELHMFNNPQLEFIPTDAFPVDTMNLFTKLYIQNNALKGLDCDLFVNQSFLPNLQEVKVFGNPFHCSCDVLWMRLLMENPTKPWVSDWKDGKDAVKCDSPAHFKGFDIFSFAPVDLTCDPPVIEQVHQFTEVNGKEFYMEVYTHRGIPMTNWTLPNGQTLLPGATYDPKTGKDVMTVTERVQANNTVYSKLSIQRPTCASSGTYIVQASNAGGSTSKEINAHPSPTNRLKKYGIIVGAGVGGLIIIAIIIIVVVTIVRKRRGQKYINLNDDTETKTENDE